MPQWVKNTVWAAGALLLVTLNLVILAYAARYLLPILLPFFVAVILALLIEPSVGFLQDKVRLPRGVAVFTMMIALLGFLGSLLGWALLRLIGELVQLSMRLPHHINALRRVTEGWVDEGVRFYSTLPPAVSEWLEGFLFSFVTSVEGFLRSTVNAALGILSGVPVMVLLVIVTVLATYFFSRDKRAIIDLWLRVMPRPFGERSLLVVRQGFGAFVKFLRAQLMLVSITITITLIGLLIIGQPYAVTIALVTGVFDFIPVVGPSTIFIPWIMWCFITGSSGLAWKLLIVYVILFLVRGFLEAKVVSINLGVHPLAVLAAMFIGLRIMGFLGLVLGPILLVIVQAAFRAGLTAWKAN